MRTTPVSFDCAVGVGVDTDVDSFVDRGRVVVYVLDGVETSVVKRPDMVVTNVLGVPVRTKVVRDPPTSPVMVMEMGADPVGVTVMTTLVGVPLMVVTTV